VTATGDEHRNVVVADRQAYSQTDRQTCSIAHHNTLLSAP